MTKPESKPEIEEAVVKENSPKENAVSASPERHYSKQDQVQVITDKKPKTPAQTPVGPNKEVQLFTPYKPGGEHDESKDSPAKSMLKAIWAGYRFEPRQKGEGPNKTSPGYIYAYELKSCPGYIKIGRSISTSRIDEWAKCGETPVELFWCEMRHRTWFLEDMIQFHLGHLRRKKEKCFGCDNEGRVHKEWFEIDKKKAQECVEFWQ
ncbi:hypothetical protein Micbo1qcDRAFT_154899, partial [Microdochium bolleyi]